MNRLSALEDRRAQIILTLDILEEPDEWLEAEYQAIEDERQRLLECTAISGGAAYEV